MSSEGDWRECMITNWSKLLLNLDTDRDLYGFMLQRETLPRMTLKRIWEIKDKSKRCSALLDTIKKGDCKRFQSFCDALNDDAQEQLVTDCLKKCSRVDFSDRVDSRVCDPLERPLPETLKSAICGKWMALLEDLSCDETLVRELENAGVFVASQRKALLDIDEGMNRNGMLLSCLLKCSERKYRLFLQVLESRSQRFLFDGLEPSGSPRDSGQSASGDQLNPQTRPTNPPDVSCRRPVQVQGPEVTAETCVLVAGTPIMDFRSRVQQEIIEKSAFDIHYDPANPSVKRGHALIISNKTFIGDKLQEREGTDVDVDSLQKLFGELLNFNVRVVKDQTSQMMLDTCKRLSDELNAESRAVGGAGDNGTKCTVLAVCVLSHGKQGAVLGTDGQEVLIDQLTTAFDGINCEALAGKPKLFFIQACQGAEKTKGVTAADGDLDSGYSSITESVTDSLGLLQLNEKADLVVVLSTYPGQVAWRNTNTGSYFVQNLFEGFSEYADREDVLSIVTKVNESTNKIPIAGKYRQTCQCITSLRRKVYLLPYTTTSVASA